MCQLCNDTYIIKSVDWVDYGSATVQMETSEVCDCLFENGCPQCGGEVDDLGRGAIGCTDQDCGWRLE